MRKAQEKATREAETTVHAFASGVDRGQIRTGNEDHALAENLPDGFVLLAVADGVGGLGHGEMASQQSIRVLRDELSRTKIEIPAEALVRAFSVANSMVRVLIREKGGARMASTLVAALVRGKEVWVAHAGDSRAYVYRKKRLQQVTRDHSWVEEQLLTGAMTPAEAANSELKNVITRGVGVEEHIQPDVTGPIELKRSDIVLLCSDGLYRPLSEQQIVNALGAPNPAAMVRTLIDQANAAGGPDNIGVALMVASA